jgi:hypothetical protein
MTYVSPFLGRIISTGEMDDVTSYGYVEETGFSGDEAFSLFLESKY